MRRSPGRLAALESSSGKLVEKEIKGGNPAITGNDEISPGVGWRLTTAPLYPSDPPAVACFLGLGNWLIPKVTVGSPDLAREPADLVTATKYTTFWVIEYCVFAKDLIDCSATTHGSLSPNTSLRLRSSKVEMLLDIFS
jgi:hypothetical protein